MRVLFACTEAKPFAQTGGLADFCGALPLALHRLGLDVRVVLPAYSSIDREQFHLLPLMPELRVDYSGHAIYGEVLRTSYPGTEGERPMPVYFIDQGAFFHRIGIYGAGPIDYPDNSRRFSFFSMAALWLLKGLDWQPQIVHANDWQTGPMPVLLRHHPLLQRDEFFHPIRTLFTIHNLVYQGNFSPDWIGALGMAPELFSTDALEFYGRASMLKGALLYADRLSTVSKTYAREIQSPEFGAGMDGVLRKRSGRLSGILNGIDTTEWEPAGDPHLRGQTCRSDEGKAQCKAALQEELHLAKSARRLVIAVISNLSEQKGIDLVLEVLPSLVELPVEIVVMGSGDPGYERQLAEAASRIPKEVAFLPDDDAGLRHRVVAGADVLLVPSAYEPSGGIQLAAQRYGTLPVVRRVGGLADSVIDATEESVAAGRASGFVFDAYTAEGLMGALRRALAMFRDEPGNWRRVRESARAKDVSWEAVAREYVELYRETLGDPSQSGTN